MTSSTSLPSRLVGVAERIPAALDQLQGPDHGRVSLPVRLAWSGPTEFNVTDPGQRLTLYRTLMDCGQRDDIVRYVNPTLLRRDWPRIRRLTARRVVALWERRMPDLAA
ncbi:MULTISPECIES: hypothetical protein [Micromonospora]|uniref:Transcriptional regulator n=1 Tax=Micromonospora solifontis TaxID=2487138 RepID=A0ABX9WEV0_9ACTN|nr:MULTISPECIES: hypothetical protein [Micromonospora]NES16947.1 hypothetical protein [Micromonospora sp. PPF5-17B]NES38277.1 hypothetical protein [Micromonospora solifontis]NES58651.1 hypothetical protein [Micromonospora sp. PPF5-6]RNL96400.1 hypothetical protein EFE23_19285 [Micromonospora solifontis]